MSEGGDVSDPMVLRAQKWLNATYAGVQGYNRITEDGLTGWGTMRALTRALQHELGITALSDTFGPTTVARLAAHGDIDAGDNGRLVSLVQCAFYCKGYDAGGIDGIYGETTRFATDRVLTDLGIGLRAAPGVPPKVVKTLLTMDAYIVIGGGTQGVRRAQQWLNERYWERSAFDLVPCDGIFSRQIQKSVLVAIQYEVGINEADITGTFGPETKRRLAAQALLRPGTVDGSSAFVRIFSALLLFNRCPGAVFTTRYDDIAAVTSAFQVFSALADSGSADFDTWAQLLVSTGNPDRACTAVDCITEVTAARAQLLLRDGYTTVGRYLTNARVPNPLQKKLQQGEVATILNAGLTLFPIFQENGRLVSDFTYAIGYEHAGIAHDAAVGFGLPTGTTIYFGVDFDFQQAEIHAAVVPYFRGVATGLADRGRRYAFGVYGSRNACLTVSERTQARYSFVSGMSTGYSGNMGYPLPGNWSFNQIQTSTFGAGTSAAIEVDRDVMSHRDPGVSALVDGGVVDELLAYVNCLQDAAQAHLGGVPANDPSVAALVLRYIRLKDYNSKAFQWFLWDAESSFTPVAEAALRAGGWAERLEYFVDPVTFDELKLSHLAASTEGYLRWQGFPYPARVSWADLTGWAGDLITFFMEWWRVEPENENAAQWVRENFANVTVASSMDHRNVVEDVDAFSTAQLLQSGMDLGSVLAHRYSSGIDDPVGAGRRYSSFLDARLVTADDLGDAAIWALTSPEFQGVRVLLDPTWEAAESVLVEDFHRRQIADFCGAIRDELAARADADR